VEDLFVKNGTRQRLPSYLGWLGLFLVAVLSIAPLVVIAAAQSLRDEPAVGFLEPSSSPLVAWGSKASIIVLMGLAIGLRTWADREDEPRPVLLCLFLVGLAGGMVAFHWWRVDYWCEAWQRDLYLKILNLDPKAGAPHMYRALPYGFVRLLEWVTGDWWFACVAYRWFFSFWFAWGCYRFARLFLSPWPAFVALLQLPVFYPLSVLYYCGQLTDPLSHALFVLALIYVVQDRWMALAVALALGVLAKETVVIVVPAYWACTWRQGWWALLRTTGLGLACVIAFFAARLPLGWQLSHDSINGTQAWMIGSNLGIDYKQLGLPHDYLGDLGIDYKKLGLSIEYTSTVSIDQNYIQPWIFVAPFLPFIALNWRQTDRRLKALLLTLTPLLLASNLCFGWMYESRNYMPLLPLLATMAVSAVARRPGPPG
jgi:hypothetical protein